MIIHHTPIPSDIFARLWPDVPRPCGAYPGGTHLTPLLTLEEVDRYHREVNGWRRVGYHHLIEPDGRIRVGRIHGDPGAHCRGYNDDTGIAVCGLFCSRHRPTDAQYAALVHLLADLVSAGDRSEIRGHGEVAPTACPGLDLDALRAAVTSELHRRSAP